MWPLHVRWSINPNILLADEPTGALDSKTGKEILDLFEQLHHESGITVIVVTHDPGIAQRADRTIFIKDGQVERDVINTNETRELVH